MRRNAEPTAHDGAWFSLLRCARLHEGNMRHDSISHSCNSRMLTLPRRLIPSACLISETHSNPAQQEVVQVLKGLLERWENGEIHKNPNGRWFQSFSLSECWLEGNEWKFESLSASKKSEQTIFPLLRGR